MARLSFVGSISLGVALCVSLVGVVVLYVSLAGPTTVTALSAAEASPDLCSLPSPVLSYESLHLMPPQILEAIRQRSQPLEFRPMAGRNANYNDTDVILEELPMQRFVQGARHGDRWVVWYEQGGFVHQSLMAALDMGSADHQPRTITVAAIYPGNACSEMTTRLTSGP